MIMKVKQYGAGGIVMWRQFYVSDPKKQAFWKAMADSSDRNTGIITRVSKVKTKEGQE